VADANTASITNIDAEVSVNIAYGYDIHGEVVGETDIAGLAESNPVVVKRERTFSGRAPADWRERFVRAFDPEFQEWLNAVAAAPPPSRAPETVTLQRSHRRRPRGVAYRHPDDGIDAGAPGLLQKQSRALKV
jgi:hypothetical protein